MEPHPSDKSTRKPGSFCRLFQQSIQQIAKNPKSPPAKENIDKKVIEKLSPTVSKATVDNEAITTSKKCTRKGKTLVGGVQETLDIPHKEPKVETGIKQNRSSGVKPKKKGILVETSPPHADLNGVGNTNTESSPHSVNNRTNASDSHMVEDLLDQPQLTKSNGKDTKGTTEIVKPSLVSTGNKSVKQKDCTETSSRRKSVPRKITHRRSCKPKEDVNHPCDSRHQTLSHATAGNVTKPLSSVRKEVAREQTLQERQSLEKSKLGHVYPAGKVDSKSKSPPKVSRKSRSDRRRKRKKKLRKQEKRYQHRYEQWLRLSCPRVKGEDWEQDLVDLPVKDSQPCTEAVTPASPEPHQPSHMESGDKESELERIDEIRRYEPPVYATIKETTNESRTCDLIETPTIDEHYQQCQSQKNGINPAAKPQQVNNDTSPEMDGGKRAIRKSFPEQLQSKQSSEELSDSANTIIPVKEKTCKTSDSDASNSLPKSSPTSEPIKETRKLAGQLPEHSIARKSSSASSTQSTNSPRARGIERFITNSFSAVIKKKEIPPRFQKLQQIHSKERRQNLPQTAKSNHQSGKAHTTRRRTSSVKKLTLSDDDDWNIDHYEDSFTKPVKTETFMNSSIEKDSSASYDNRLKCSEKLSHEEPYDAEAEDEDDEEGKEVGVEDKQHSEDKNSTSPDTHSHTAVTQSHNVPFLIPADSASPAKQYGTDSSSSVVHLAKRTVEEPYFPSPPSYNLAPMAQSSGSKLSSRHRVLKCGPAFSRTTQGPSLRPTLEPENPPPLPGGRCNVASIHKQRFSPSEQSTEHCPSSHQGYRPQACPSEDRRILEPASPPPSESMAEEASLDHHRSPLSTVCNTSTAVMSQPSHDSPEEGELESSNDEMPDEEDSRAVSRRTPPVTEPLQPTDSNQDQLNDHRHVSLPSPVPPAEPAIFRAPTPRSYRAPTPPVDTLGHSDNEDKRNISTRGQMSIFTQSPWAQFGDGESWADLEMKLRASRYTAGRGTQDANNNDGAVTRKDEASPQRQGQVQPHNIIDSGAKRPIKGTALDNLAKVYADDDTSSMGSVMSDEPSSYCMVDSEAGSITSDKENFKDTPKKPVSFSILSKPRRVNDFENPIASSEKVKAAALRSRNMNRYGTWQKASASHRPLDVAMLINSAEQFSGVKTEDKRPKGDDSPSSSPEADRNRWKDGFPGNWDSRDIVKSSFHSKKKPKREPVPNLMDKWTFKSLPKSFSSSALETLAMTPPCSDPASKISRWSGTSPTWSGSSPSASLEWKDSWKTKLLERYSTCTVPYIDTHCHLDFIFDRSGFKGSYEKYRNLHSETYPQNYAGCVAVFCNPRTFNSEGGLWKDVLYEDRVWAAVGCHPKSATEFTDRAQVAMVTMIKHPKVMAVGEIGLDYSGTFQRHEAVQKQVFRRQLMMAVAAHKPIVIHCRDAESDCISIMQELVPRDHVIHRHCFTGSWAEGRVWLEYFPNSYLGLTPLVTWRTERAYGMRDVARNIPLDRLVLETDAPYFIPRRVPRDEMPFSHPGLAITVADEVAFIRDIPIDDVLKQCLANSKRLYGLDL